MKIKNNQGFSLIELVAFLVILSIIGSGALLSFNHILRIAVPAAHRQMAATEAAERCMEWFYGQRQMAGYSSITCPSTTVPSFCAIPTGYTVSVNVACTTIGGDSNYKTITVNVAGQSTASLSLIIASY